MEVQKTRPLGGSVGRTGDRHFSPAEKNPSPTYQHGPLREGGKLEEQRSGSSRGGDLETVSSNKGGYGRHQVAIGAALR